MIAILAMQPVDALGLFDRWILFGCARINGHEQLRDSAIHIRMNDLPNDTYELIYSSNYKVDIRMNQWPIKIIAVDDNAASVVFSPYDVKSQGLAAYPFVELDVEEIFDAIPRAFGLQVSHLYLTKFEFMREGAAHLTAVAHDLNLPIMPKRTFLNELDSGMHLEALFVSDEILLVILGTDETWVIFDPVRFPKATSQFYGLIERSKNNMDVLGCRHRFDDFF